jgi:glutamine amidotransferase
MKVVIVDLGTGNLHSVRRAVEHVAAQAEVLVSDRAADLDAAERVIFPGQGAIGTWMGALRAKGLEDAVRRALAGKPVLGICLGLQALYEDSEEDGGTPGLALLHGRVRHFNGLAGGRLFDVSSGAALKIPHMGWNTVRQTRPHPLWQGIPDSCRFYFVHSYCAPLQDPGEVLGTTEYGVRFCSAAGRGNVFAVQFHPEKSQRAGLTLLGNFIGWSGSA